VVLVHDAARPFPPTETFDELVAAAREAGCAILAIPVADTLREGQVDRPDRGARTVPRDRLWAVQTPQAFRLAELTSRLAEAARNGQSVTDEAHLFETGGLEVAFVKGSPFNFKITTGEDLRLAEAVLAMDSLGKASAEART
jgi:2-C-methyl-D-erythritol 4-phosphate cytidylyltransferase